MHFQLFRCCVPLVALVLLLPAAVRAQQVPLTGVVVDAASEQAIPFAVVEIRSRHVGVQATEQGTFSLVLPSTITATDSLQVSSLGFISQVLPLPSASPCRLTLRPLSVALPEAVVRPPGPPVVLDPTANGGRSGFASGNMRSVGSKAWQVGRKFETSHRGVFHAVRFYVKPNFHCGKTSVKAPFRVRLYAADGVNGAPGTDLLTASVLTAASRSGWHEVDLRRYQVAVPAVGFYVAMEWLYTDGSFGCEYTYSTAGEKAKKTGYAYGPSLGGYYDSTPSSTWYLTAGYPWQPFTHRSIPRVTDKDEVHSAAIQAIIQPD